MQARHMVQRSDSCFGGVGRLPHAGPRQMLRSMLPYDPDMADILHRGPRYCVRFLRCEPAPWAVVYFEHWATVPDRDAPCSAERFFAHRGISAVCVRGARNDWFQHPEMTQVVAAIRRATPGLRLVGYGGSMGGFAALAFSEALGLRAVVAVCPQYTIDGLRAPYERRWRNEAAEIAAEGGFTQDTVNGVTPLGRGWLIYDPDGVDGRHAERILAHHPLGALPLRLGGHAPMLALQQAGLYADVLVAMLEDRFDLARFRQAWRQARRQSAVFWIELSYWLRRRGRFQAARQAAQQARALPHPEPAAIDMMQAEAGLHLGRAEEVRSLAQPWVQDPVWGETARWCLAQL